MPANNIPYKQFLWSLGTTSFRTKQFNKVIEEQLRLVKRFREMYPISVWSGNDELQTKYYDFLRENNFITGIARNKPKDAREKTSGLVDIGLLNEERYLTPVGKRLLDLSLNQNFKIDNDLQIASDSYIYLKQLLKTTCYVNEQQVRPLLVILYLLGELENLTYEEFTYLAPLCITAGITKAMVRSIRRLRERDTTIDEIIVSVLLRMDNYRNALDMFLSEPVTEDLICTIGMNRKSRTYDKSYYPLYKTLYSVCVEKNWSAIYKVYEATKNVKIGRLWRNCLFDTDSKNAIRNNPKIHFYNKKLLNADNDENFKIMFFELMHLFKARATLHDYFDLNKRYIGTTDIFRFREEKVCLDMIPKYIFMPIKDYLFQDAFQANDKLFQDCTLQEIGSYLEISEQEILSGISKEIGTPVVTYSEVKNIVEEERYKRLNTLIDTKFKDSDLLKIITCFENREDDILADMITDNADVPTMFEYIIGIIWFKLSNREGKILDYMGLSLDADLLPKTHAGGGEADIIYEYTASSKHRYPTHTLLIEMTLANDPSNQRRMEMEPVSRHLGEYMLSHREIEAYATFVSTHININVISDFLLRRNMPYYNSHNFDEYVTGLKIIPIDTNKIKEFIERHYNYDMIYELVNDLYNRNLRANEWDKFFINEIKSLNEYK